MWELELLDLDGFSGAARDFAVQFGIAGLPGDLALGLGKRFRNRARKTVPWPGGTTSRNVPSGPVSRKRAKRDWGSFASAAGLKSTIAFATPWPVAPSTTRPFRTSPSGSVIVCSISLGFSGSSTRATRGTYSNRPGLRAA